MVELVALKMDERTCLNEFKSTSPSTNLNAISSEASSRVAFLEFIYEENKYFKQNNSKKANKIRPQPAQPLSSLHAFALHSIAFHSAAKKTKFIQ